MSLELLVKTFGYWALFVGTFLEGETILIICGFFAHRGYLELAWVIVVAFMGSLAGDQLYFFIGRLRGRAFLTKRPTWQQRIDKVYHLLERYHTPIILGFRFMYGLRTVIPFAIGMSQIKTGNFIILNVVGALAWATVVGTLGYMFGAALEVIITDIEHYELEVITGICIIGILMWTLHFFRRKRLNGKKR